MTPSATSFTSTIASTSNISDLPAFTTNVDVHLPIDKLDDKNYTTWVFHVKLWLESQGYLNYLTLKVTNIALGDFPRWKIIDAHLCMVLKNTIQSHLKPIFRAYDTCYEVSELTKLLYTNDAQYLHGVCYDLFNVVSPRTQDPVADYLRR